ncbi:MAG: lamin tail domain-containing protein [Polyangiaceae bacterium]
MMRVSLFWVLIVAATACGGKPEADTSTGTSGGNATGGQSSTCRFDPSWSALRLNELASDNDGLAIDEGGRTDDFIELINTGNHDLDLSQVELVAGGTVARLPAETLEVGQRVIFWADGEDAPEHHSVPVRLSRDGEKVALRACGKMLDSVDLPALKTNEVFARFPDGSGDFTRCRFATVSKSNGERCEPGSPPDLDRGHVFAPYSWTLPHPQISKPFTVDELLLRPEGFAELRNTGDTASTLNGYRLFLSPLRPGAALPGIGEGREIAIPSDRTLEPGERIVAPISALDIAPIAESESFEGVASLFGPDGSVVERVDFAWVPEGAALARIPEYPGRHVFCSPATPEEDNAACAILATRHIGQYDRHFENAFGFRNAFCWKRRARFGIGQVRRRSRSG